VSISPIAPPAVPPAKGFTKELRTALASTDKEVGSLALLTYLGACAAALRYRVRGEMTLALVGGAFCIFVIGWSTLPVLIATFICLVLFVLIYLALSG